MKYGSVLKSLNSQKSPNNNQFSETMVGGNNLLSNYYFDNAKEISKEFKKNLGNSRNSYVKQNKKKDDKAMLLTFTQIKRHTISVETLDI